MLHPTPNDTDGIMDDFIKDFFSNNIPYTAFSSVTVTELGDGTAQAVLPEKPELTNHIGSQHAAALFLVGETASGAALATVLGAALPTVRPVAKDAKIAYEKVARGAITAFGTASRPTSEVREELEREGKVVFDVDVVMKDASDLQVASMSVTWHVKKNA